MLVTTSQTYSHFLTAQEAHSTPESSPRASVLMTSRGKYEKLYEQIKMRLSNQVVCFF